MKYKRIWIPLNPKNNIISEPDYVSSSIYPCDDEDSKKADETIENMLNTGWKIISTTPITASHNILRAGGDDVYQHYTSGIEVFMIKES